MSDQSLQKTIQKPGYLSAEFIAQRAPFYVSYGNKKVLLGCGDDRQVTADSSQKIASQFTDALPVSEGYVSMYGAVAGVAKNVLIAGIAQYGPQFVERIGGFDGAFEKAVKGMLSDDSFVIPALHSAEVNEGNAAGFNPNAEAKVGCAYAEGVGATSSLLVDETDPLIRDQAHDDQVVIFGNDEHVDDLMKAHRTFLEKATHSLGSEFIVGRATYAKTHVPIIILLGAHTSAKTSGLINNFDLHKVRNATAAHDQNKDFYNQDVAIVTAATLDAFKEYNLDPEVLMRAYVLDSTPVRAVLAAGDADPELNGKLDPRNLPMGIVGEPQVALQALRAA